MEYHLLSDELLVKLLKVDDEGAFSEIYKRYWKSLFKAAQQKLKAEDAIEEILQNVFLKIWERRHVIEIQALDKYLFKAAKFQIMDYYRAQFMAEKYADFTSQKHEQFEITPEQSFNLEEITHIFDHVITSLPEKTSTIFNLSRVEQKSTKEISSILQVPERTVEYHITQSLKLLRKHLKDYLPAIILLLCSN